MNRSKLGEVAAYHMCDCVDGCPPVLLVAFNRPELTRRVFERIQAVRPRQLFVAVDGPRPDRPDDVDKCAAVRAIVDDVDWPCEVHTLFRDRNLGCKRAVSSAITWFFSQVEEGIILEDDCLAEITFFQFCGELLAHYRNDKRVMLIGGNNFQPAGWQNGFSYYFSMYPHIWGWASWRRAWLYYDIDMSLWPELYQDGWLTCMFGEQGASLRWTWAFNACFNKTIDTWDYQLTYSWWLQNGLSVIPSANLVSNIGFGEDSTHTGDTTDWRANLATCAMQFPLLHPAHMIRDYAADEYTLRTVYGVSRYVPPSLLSRVRHRLRRTLSSALGAAKRAFY